MSIFDEIGGAAAVRAVVDAFADRVLADPMLAPAFDGIELDRLKGHQRAFIAATIGGPDAYLGRAMGEAHAHLAITTEAFAAIVGHLAGALADLGVPTPTIDAVTAALAPLEAEVVGGAGALEPGPR
jgi:hemoglobin